MSHPIKERVQTMENLLAELIQSSQATQPVNQGGHNLQDKNLPDALQHVPSNFRPAIYARERQAIGQWEDYLLPFLHLPPESHIVRSHIDNYAAGMALESCEEYQAGRTLLTLVVALLAYAKSIDP
ncbi:hypothetical protein H4R33_005775, partial [Dimargaris cristalligena]